MKKNLKEELVPIEIILKNKKSTLQIFQSNHII